MITAGTDDSAFVTTNFSGVLVSFECRRIERVAAESLGATSPKFTPAGGSTRNVGRTTPEMLTRYSGWCFEFVTMRILSASGPILASGPPTVMFTRYWFWPGRPTFGARSSFFSIFANVALT